MIKFAFDKLWIASELPVRYDIIGLRDIRLRSSFYIYPLLSDVKN